MSNADELRDANPWHPMTKPIDLKHLGKLGEELCEASAAVFAILPIGAGIGTWAALQDELADVEANIELVCRHFDLTGPVVLPPLGPFADETRRLLSFGRLLGIAGAAVARCVIQGIDEREPVTGKLNRDWIRESLVIVSATIPTLVATLNFDATAMARRRARKLAHLKQWHGMLEEAK